MKSTSGNTPDIQETHITHEDKEEINKEPTAYDQRILEEMNVINLQHETEIENADNHARTNDEDPESPQDTQTANTDNHGLNL